MVFYFNDKSQYHIQNFNYVSKLFEIIVFIRAIKLLSLLREIKIMRIIIETLKNLVAPLSNLIIVMMTIMYCFA